MAVCFCKSGEGLLLDYVYGGSCYVAPILGPLIVGNSHFVCSPCVSISSRRKAVGFALKRVKSYGGLCLLEA